MIDPNTLLRAYAQGIFPMADSKNGKIEWYSFEPRGIIDLDDFIVPKRLLRYIKNLKYKIKIDFSFEQVMRECSNRPEEEKTWISEEMIESYVNLHRLGFAHSVEVYIENKLVGGLYGVTLKGAFFGESMFNRVSNASKIALYHLIQNLNLKRYRLLDIQMLTPTTEVFSAKEITREEYLEKLAYALEINCEFV